MFHGAAHMKVSLLLAAMFVFCFIAMVSAQVLDIQVEAENDDMEQYLATGLSDPGSSDLELGVESGGDQIVGARFTKLAIPKGATITKAYVVFEADEVGTSKNINPCVLTIQGQAADNAPEFVNDKVTLNLVSGLHRTTSSVTWSPPDWMVEHEKGAGQTTPDIKAIIQEIVNRAGWASGNSIVILITGTGRRYAEAFEGEPAGGPILHVEYTISVGGTFDIQVAGENDDMEQYLDGSKTGLSDPGSSDLELGVESGGTQIVGARFNKLTIPKGATITKAYVVFEADEVGASKNINPCVLTIQGQAADNAPEFANNTTTPNLLSGRPTTTASVTWSPPDWMVEHEKGAGQTTPDIKAIIQEIVNRSGWASGNSIVILITGTGRRYAEAFEGEPAGGPILHVEYTTGTAVDGKAALNLPSGFALGNYPNPFNPSTKIHYDLPEAGQVRIVVLDMNGREVSTLVNGMQRAGSYELVWNAVSVPSGTYLCRLQAGSRMKTIKMLYMK